MTPSTPVQVTARVVGVKRASVYRQLSMVAPGIPERFRPGTFVTVRVGGDLSSRLLPRAFAIYRVRASGSSGGTVEIVFEVTDDDTRWLSELDAGAKLSVVGPLGRPFSLPREPVVCTLVGGGEGSAPLFPLAEALRERGCSVHMLLAAATESRLFGAIDAKRGSKTLLVSTEDGSVGVRAGVGDVLPTLIARTRSEVVYSSGPPQLLHAVASAAAAEGVWSQTALRTEMPCGTGICLGCLVPVVDEAGEPTMLRACVEGPVFRGDLVRWDELFERRGEPAR